MIERCLTRPLQQSVNRVERILLLVSVALQGAQMRLLVKRLVEDPEQGLRLVV